MINDVDIFLRLFFVIIIGVNMVGKSIYLCIIGVNYVLVCIGCFVCCFFFEIYFVKLVISLWIFDLLIDNEFYFFVELKWLK